MRIVVTGSIGTGKSTICAALHRHMPDHELVSADQMVRDLYATNGDFRAELLTRFDTADRKVISSIVFADPSQRVALETLSWQYLAATVDDVFRKQDVIFEFPLFFESGRWSGKPDAVILLGCDPQVQRARVLARDGITARAYENIRAAQMPMEEKKRRADLYLDTSGNMTDVLLAVSKLPAAAREVCQARTALLSN